MKLPILLLTTTLTLCLVQSAVSTEAPPLTPTAQALYLQAGKQERQGETVKARETYEQIIDRFPESEFAVKANDRLLVLPPAAGKVTAHPVTPLSELHKTTPAPVPADLPVAAPVKSPVPPQAKPATGIDTLFAPSQLKPLPADPLKRRGVEQARLYQQAQSTYRDEISRHQFAHNAKYGRKYNRSDLVDLQQEWEHAAEERVRKEFGKTLVEIKEQLQAICTEARITGSCNEAAFAE